jgi:hypothetical protein
MTKAIRSNLVNRPYKCSTRTVNEQFLLNPFAAKKGGGRGGALLFIVSVWEGKNPHLQVAASAGKQVSYI